MMANYEYYGFRVTAKELPEAAGSAGILQHIHGICKAEEETE